MLKISSPVNNFAAAFPELLGEWHQERNGDLSPYDLFPYSGKSFGGNVSKGMNGKQQLIAGVAGRAVPIAIGREANVCEKYLVNLQRIVCHNSNGNLQLFF